MTRTSLPSVKHGFEHVGDIWENVSRQLNKISNKG